MTDAYLDRPLVRETEIIERNVREGRTPEYMHAILHRILPDILDKFDVASGDYGDAYKLLGEKGQFSDINRKFWKMYNAIWLGQPLSGESLYQITDDVICHCLLLRFIWWERDQAEKVAALAREAEELERLRDARGHEEAAYKSERTPGQDGCEEDPSWDEEACDEDPEAPMLLTPREATELHKLLAKARVLVDRAERRARR